MRGRYENRRRDKVEGGPPPKGMRLDIVPNYDRATGESPPIFEGPALTLTRFPLRPVKHCAVFGVYQRIPRTRDAVQCFSEESLRSEK